MEGIARIRPGHEPHDLIGVVVRLVGIEVYVPMGGDHGEGVSAGIQGREEQERTGQEESGCESHRLRVCLEKSYGQHPSRVQPPRSLIRDLAHGPPNEDPRPGPPTL